jgi:hypothetical protein
VIFIASETSTKKALRKAIEHRPERTLQQGVGLLERGFEGAHRRGIALRLDVLIGACELFRPASDIRPLASGKT